jgi:hypothetical protein
MAAVRCHRSEPPPASPTSRAAPPRRLLRPRRRNRAAAPGIAATAVVSLAGSDLAAAEIRRHRSSSGQADSPGIPLVSFWPRRAFPCPWASALAPPSSAHRRPPAPERNGRAGSLTQSTQPTWPLRWTLGPLVSDHGSS